MVGETILQIQDDPWLFAVKTNFTTGILERLRGRVEDTCSVTRQEAN